MTDLKHFVKLSLAMAIVLSGACCLHAQGGLSSGDAGTAFTEEGLPLPKNTDSQDGASNRAPNQRQNQKKQPAQVAVSPDAMTVENLQGRWPMQTQTQALEPVRNVFLDPRRKELAKVKKAQKDGTPAASAVPAVSQTQLAIEKQTQAWEQLRESMRITSLFNLDHDDFIVVQIAETGKLYQLKINEPQQLVLTDKKLRPAQTQGSIRMDYYQVPTRGGARQAASRMSLETITLRLLRVNARQLLFQIEEINGETFFGEEQPIWVYELNNA